VDTGQGTIITGEIFGTGKGMDEDARQQQCSGTGAQLMANRSPGTVSGYNVDGNRGSTLNDGALQQITGCDLGYCTVVVRL